MFRLDWPRIPVEQLVAEIQVLRSREAKRSRGDEKKNHRIGGARKKIIGELATLREICKGIESRRSSLTKKEKKEETILSREGGR